MIGSKVSHYNILERIGAGGMGEVYKAFDARLDRTIALKVLNPSAVADEGKLQRFMQEARTVSALNHPNILTIYEIGQEHDRHYIATEYIEGVTLRKNLRNGPLPVKVVLEIATQVVKAIGVAHLAGIIHRDIKPENIMIRPDGYVKVLDFGLAKLMEPIIVPGAAGARPRSPIVKTEYNVVLGTVRYMSPEQVQHHPIDHRTDIFSLGVLLYEMLTGQMPFDGPQKLDIAYDIISAEPLPLTGAAQPFQFMLNRCLEKDPNARYQDAQSLLKDLRQLHRRLELTDVRPSGELLPALVDTGRIAPPPSTRPSIIIIYFENLAGDPELQWWCRALMELVTARLMSNVYLEVVNSQQLADLFQQFDLDSKDEVDKATIWDIARRAGVENCLLGSFMALGGGISVSAHLHEVNTGRPIVSFAGRRAQAEEIFSLVDELVGRIEGELDVARNDTLDVSNLVTGSLVALRAFHAGCEYYREDNFVSAEQQFQQAIAADPRFSLAYYYLARIERWQDKPVHRQHLEAALECSQQPSERLLIALEKASLQQDYTAQMRLAEDLIVQFPREKKGYVFLAEAYHWRGECDRAFIVFQQALAIEPGLLFEGMQAGAGINSVCETYLDTGHFERVEQLAREEAAHHPQNWLAYQLLGIVYYYQRAYQEAESALAQAALLNNTGLRYPQFWQARIHILAGEFDVAEEQLQTIMDGCIGMERLVYWRDLAETRREQGRLRDWFKLLASETEIFTRGSIFDPSFAPQFWRGYFFEQVGQPEQALSEYEHALNRLDAAPDSMSMTDALASAWARVHLGRMLAARGEYERVAELAEQIKLIGRNLPSPKVEQLGLFLWGSSEFYQGNYEQAAELLERSIWSYHNGFALAIRMLAQCLRQLKQYQRALELLEWLQPYGTLSSGNRFCSRTQLDLEMAKTYEAGKQPEKAIEFYHKCLQAWANADADFVGRQEAETGLALLTR